MNATVPLVILGFGAATGIALLVELAPPGRPGQQAATREVPRGPAKRASVAPARTPSGGDEGCSHCDGEGADGTVPASANYPLATCVVSGEKLGKMGPPVAVVHGGVEVQLCCAGCIKEFRKAPDRYAALVARAKPGGATEGTR
ncbi:MAG: hypothetical protein HUU06_00915 [Planctomycetaceae bacterium]|nr:hypothetical protein [Planctomycetota bacterium]NUN51333.1 hypothetical protein [Planctomycetaceae bacterium]